MKEVERSKIQNGEKQSKQMKVATRFKLSDDQLILFCAGPQFETQICVTATDFSHVSPFAMSQSI